MIEASRNRGSTETPTASVSRSGSAWIAAVSAVVMLAVYYVLVRPWHRTWGATNKEVTRQLPGDDVVPGPSDETTRAVTVEAPNDDVWSWVVQLGQGRGGFYSYTWLENFVGMLAASVGLIDALATQASDRTSRPILASGISLGGWAVNLYRACFDTVDQYVPIFAGAALGEMFVSSVYRKMTAGLAQKRPDHLIEVLDFEEEFRAVEAANCAPLLARYDRIIEYDRQHSAYAEMSLSVLDNGHVTGSLATDRLREHVLCVLSACDTDRAGRE